MKHLVVARYQEDTGWYSRIPADWTLLEVQKGREVENTGREASSYLWAILRLYDGLADDDRVAFVQGNPFDHCHDVDLFLLLARNPDGFLPLGDSTYICDGHGQPHHEGLPMVDRYERWLGEKFPGGLLFAPGAQFVVTGADIKRRPASFYAGLLDEMAEHPNPWVIERLWHQIFRAPSPVPNKASFYCQATAATTYLRCELPARYLPGKVMRDIVLAQPQDDYAFPMHEGAAVFQFAGDSTYALMQHALSCDSPGGAHKAVRVMVEVDDNYFAAGPNLKKSGWAKKIGDGMHTLQGHASIVGWADGCIVTTDYLANIYRKRNPNVYVCPNSLDPIDWPALTKPTDGVLRIGWFASNSHKMDQQLVRRALEWASKQDGVEVVTMGYDPPWKFRRRHIGWQDLPAYREAMFELDVGVAPVVPNPWSNCRSDIKAVEKAFAGAALVLSDVPPYALWRGGENCLKAKDARGFFEQVRHLVQHRDEVKPLAAAGRDYVMGERLTRQVIGRWQEAVTGENDVRSVAA